MLRVWLTTIWLAAASTVTAHEPRQLSQSSNSSSMVESGPIVNLDYATYQGVANQTTGLNIFKG